MKFYKSILGVLFFMLPFVLHGQTDESANVKSYTLKLYFNGNYRHTEDSNYKGLNSGNTSYLNDQKNYDFGIPSIALEFKTAKKIATEIEFLPLNLKIEDDIETSTFYNTINLILSGSKNTFIESHIRYQMNYYLIRNKTIEPYIGFSTKLFYDLDRVNPKISIYFKDTKQNIGLNFAICPSISLRLTDIFSIDVNVPIGLYEFKLNSENIENPILPKREQKTSKFVGEFMPTIYNFRIGLKCKI